MQGRTTGRLYCCEASGGALFTVNIYREGTRWYTDSGRNLMLFLTELFHESMEVKFARAVIPAQNRTVWFRMVDGSAKATYEEAIEKGEPDVEYAKRGRQKGKRDTATFNQPNLGGKQ